MNSSSSAADVVIAVIPIVGILMGGAVSLLYMFYSYKQKKHMIEKGIYKRIRLDLRGIVFFSGFPLTATGLGLSVFFVIMDGISYGILSGLIPFMIGISFIAYHICIHHWKSNNQE